VTRRACQIGPLKIEGQTTPLLLLLSLLFGVSCGGAQRLEAAPDTSESEGEVQSARRFSLPFELVDRHVILEARIAGEQHPARFLFHSRAETILDLGLARRLSREENEPLLESGERIWLNQLALGQASFRGIRVTTLDLSEARRGVGLERLDGILGLALFQQYEVTIDYPQRQIHFLDAAVAPASREGVVVPFELQGDAPVLTVDIADIEARLVLDLGARSSVTLSTAFVEEQELGPIEADAGERIVGWSVEGPLRAHPLRLESLRVGSLEQEGVIAAVRPSSGSAAAESAPVGALGAGYFLEQRVVIDLLRRRIVLSGAAAEPASDDRSGLWLVRGDGGLEVAEVAPRSPAAGAGLRRGDRVVGALEQRGSQLDLFALRRALEGPAGESVELEIAGAEGGERTVTLELSD
jgi:hypothetical protein